MIDLRDFSKKVWSQRGEDGIIEKIFDVLEIKEGHAVELGAWDGIKYSNVYNLIQKGWAATLIEGDPDKYKELIHNMKPYSKVQAFHKMISLDAESTLTSVLESSNVPFNFEILSLDLDGIDYWVWRELKHKPKVVVVEYNSNWDESATISYEKNHVWDGTQYYGASATALNELATIKGYELISHVPNTNLFFIDKSLNKGKFKTLDLSTGFHISKNHHLPMTKEQEDKIVKNPKHIL